MVKDTEIIHLDNSNESCKIDADDFPRGGTVYAIGAFLKDKAFFCGGGGLFKYSKHYSNCVNLGSRESVADMSTKRKGAASAIIDFDNGTQSLWITGGRNNETKFIQSTEYVYPTGSVSPGPDLPVALLLHCVVALDKSNVIVIGGNTKEAFKNKETYLFNLVNQSWSNNSSSLTIPRRAQACGQVSIGNEKAVVVAGGDTKGKDNMTKTTEILLSPGLSWQSGPDMPKAIASAGSVSAPDGSFLVIGGQEPGNLMSRDIYRLKCQSQDIATCQWTRLQQSLTVARSQHVAILVPGKGVCEKSDLTV